MRAMPTKLETFRDDFTYSNSPEAIARFPFPFPEDEYMYSVNIEPHTLPGPKGTVNEFLIDLDEHYLSETADRAIVLQQNPARCKSLEHMNLACWDLLEYLMKAMAKDYPNMFSLQCEGDNWTWTNHALNIHDTFIFGDNSSLPMPPLEYIGRQVQGDFNLLDQRDDNLFMDAGIITSQADWSLEFDLGMSFTEWHGPVPLAHEMGVFDRALKYLLALQVGQPIRRLNWTMTVNPRMDTAPETYPEWGIDRTTVTPENVANKVYLRVELQLLDRMPRSHAIVFSIRTYLMNLEDICTNPVWAKRLYRVLSNLPEVLVDYKGLSRYHPMVVDYLSQFDSPD